MLIDYSLLRCILPNNLPSLYSLYKAESFFILFGLEFHQPAFAPGHGEILLVLGLLFRNRLDYLLLAHFPVYVDFNVPEVRLIEQLYQSVGCVPFVSMDLTHLADYYGLKVLADCAEIGVTHYRIA